MIRITRGTVTLTVTKGAFNSFYKPLGFVVEKRPRSHEASERVITQPDSDSTHSEDSTQQKSDDKGAGSETDEKTDYKETPISEMSFDQLCDYAEDLGLDYEGVRSKKELRMLIRESLNN